MAGIEKLTALKVSKTAKAGKYSDGKGLYLQVTKQLVKSWVFRYERGGSEHFMGVGPYPFCGAGRGAGGGHESSSAFKAGYRPPASQGREVRPKLGGTGK